MSEEAWVVYFAKVPVTKYSRKRLMVGHYYHTWAAYDE